VKLSDNNGLKPQRTRIPYHSAIRWEPKDEEMQRVRPPLDIFLTQNAFVRMCAHAGSDLDNEVGGWMAGKYCRDSLHGEPFIVVDTILPAVYTEQGAAHLTFTGDTQVALHNHLEDTTRARSSWVGIIPTRAWVFSSPIGMPGCTRTFSGKMAGSLVIEPHHRSAAFSSASRTARWTSATTLVSMS
jgi:hypothetical protein